MAHVTSDKVLPGMVLAGDVVDGRGRLLIPGGNELTERHVEALRMWGVSHVEIEGDGPADEATTSIDPSVLEAARAAVERRFVTAGADGAFLKQLREQAVLQTAHRMASEEVGP